MLSLLTYVAEPHGLKHLNFYLLFAGDLSVTMVLSQHLSDSEIPAASYLNTVILTRPISISHRARGVVRPEQVASPLQGNI